MSLPQPLLALLADGRFHSGADLGARLGISRSAVWKQMQSLAELGVEVQAVAGRGYRLPHPLQWLDAAAVRDAMSVDAKKHLHELILEPVLDSTSQHLLSRAATQASGTACLAELQRQGRGRRGRQWQSPLAAHIYLSVLWRFPAGAAALSGLSLAIGVAVLRALTTLGVRDAGLKWPNDVQWQQRKLAGVLIDLTGEINGPCTAVVGVGLNWRMPNTAGTQLDQPWIDLDALLHGRQAQRSVCAGILLGEVLLALDDFERRGLAAFMPEWQRWDSVAGHAVTLHLADRKVHGTARGIDATGALLVECEGQVMACNAGEVSVRTVP